MDTSGPTQKLSHYPLSLLSGPLNKFKIKQFKESLNRLIVQVNSFGPKINTNKMQENLTAFRFFFSL